MSKPIRVLPFLFFIVSGAWGLVYEVTWARYLSLFIGDTTLAHMCVLAGFMGGLALGSVYIGRMTARFRRPLAVYGWLEAAIGLYAIAFPFFIQPVQSMVLSAASGLEPGTALWLAVKLVTAMGVLLLPTFLMGGTFPVLMRHFQPETLHSEDKAEWLYLVNCVGAVGGTLMAGFVFIPSMGMMMTLASVGAANAALGLAAILMAMVMPESSTPEEHAGEPKHEKRVLLLLPVCIAMGLSGLAAMVYELVWIRMFAITLGSSTYSFTLMLAAFISGIALGSLAVGMIPAARKGPLMTFALSELAIGLAVIISIPLYERLPYAFWKWLTLLRPTEESIWLNDLFKYGLCFAVMLVPTFFFGMTLPLAIKAIAHRDERIGRDSGLVYGANTAGTLVGALLTGLVLIPVLGLRHSLEVALVINAITAAILFTVSGYRHRKAVGIGVVVAAVLLLLVIPQWNPVSFTRTTIRMTGSAPSSWDVYRESLSCMNLVYWGEDGTASVAVIDSQGRTPDEPERTLSINGKPDGTAIGDMPTQVLVGQIPMLFADKAREVLVIGLGTGMTAGSVLTHPGTSVDCVEISPAVAKAARHFSEVNHSVLDNKRFRLMVDDARSYVAATSRRYDLIISEPTNPWIAGVGNLFSKEFFESADRILKPGGIIVQWFHTYDMTDELAQMIIRTLRTVFPYAYVFAGEMDDYIVIGSREPIEPDFAAMERRLKVAAVRADLDRTSTDSLAAILSRQVLSAQGAEQYSGDGVLNTDDLPVLEYSAPRAQYTHALATRIKEGDERRWGGENLFITHYLKTHPMGKQSCKSLIRMYSDPRMNDPELLGALLRHYLDRWPGDAQALWDYSRVTAATDPTSALKAVELSASLHPSALAYEMHADILLSQLLRMQTIYTPQDFSQVLSLLEKAIRLDPQNQGLQQKHAQVSEMIR